MKKYVFLIANALAAIVLTGVLAIYRFIMYILGFILQPLAIKFAVEDKKNAKLFTEYPQHGVWYKVTAPKWLFPWGNERDGFLGDKRGWWANEVDGDEESFKSQYRWSAIRNPCNNMRFMPFSSCNAKESVITLLAGDEYVRDKVGREGWQFVRAIDDDNIPYYGFYFVKAKKDNPTRGIVIRIGFKVEPRHTQEYANVPVEPYASYFKGMTFRVSFDKDIS